MSVMSALFGDGITPRKKRYVKKKDKSPRGTNMNKGKMKLRDLNERLNKRIANRNR